MATLFVAFWAMQRMALESSKLEADCSGSMTCLEVYSNQKSEDEETGTGGKPRGKVAQAEWVGKAIYYILIPTLINAIANNNNVIHRYLEHPLIRN